MDQRERPDGLPGPRQARGIADFDALYAARVSAWDIRPASVGVPGIGRPWAPGGRRPGRSGAVPASTPSWPPPPDWMPHAWMRPALLIAIAKGDERVLTAFPDVGRPRLADLGQSFSYGP